MKSGLNLRALLLLHQHLSIYMYRLLLAVIPIWCWMDVTFAEQNHPPVELTLFNFNNHINPEALKYLKTNDVRIKSSATQPGFLQVTTGTQKKWPNLTITPRRGKATVFNRKTWDLSIYEEVSVDVRNLEDRPLTVYLRVDSPMLTNKKLNPWVTNRVTIPAHQTRTLHVKLTRGHSKSPELVGMRTLPQGLDNSSIRPEKISALVVFTDRASKAQTYEIGTIKAHGRYQKKTWEDMTADNFFPFIDVFGQFKHDNWPGKIKALADFKQQITDETKLLGGSMKPDNWNQYGGWQKGPTLKPTGHFRAEKINDQWWLVDPDGRLFWSHGIDVIKLRDNHTITSGREHYFSSLPSDGQTLAQYFHALKPDSVANGYFRGKPNLRAYSFSAANLHQKYGKSWKNIYPDIVHKRLEYWGMNTMGLWSDPQWTSMKRTAYVEWMYYQSPKIQGKTKRWKRLIDMWHPKFKRALDGATGKIDKIKDDPWLIGLFVDNEIAWQDALSFTNEVLSSPAAQPAKTKLLEYLKSRYESIEQLNTSWSTHYNSWRTLLNSRTIIKLNERFKMDANSFFRQSAEHYYKTVRETIKEKAPDMLYLCSRFAGHPNRIVVQTAAKYCDIISYNLYADITDSLALPEEIDKPVIIGEWHFGANDRGVFGRGLRPAKNQQDRADKYSIYASSAIRHQNIVGIHWFQYMDEITSGRYLEGENHQIGFISITDTPYKEIIDASRQFSKQMYESRFYIYKK